jgi:hypothetical protein
MSCSRFLAATRRWKFCLSSPPRTSRSRISGLKNNAHGCDTGAQRGKGAAHQHEQAARLSSRCRAKDVTAAFFSRRASSEPETILNSSLELPCVLMGKPASGLGQRASIFACCNGLITREGCGQLQNTVTKHTGTRCRSRRMRSQKGHAHSLSVCAVLLCAALYLPLKFPFRLYFPRLSICFLSQSVCEHITLPNNTSPSIASPSFRRKQNSNAPVTSAPAVRLRCPPRRQKQQAWSAPPVYVRCKRFRGQHNSKRNDKRTCSICGDTATIETSAKSTV